MNNVDFNPNTGEFVKKTQQPTLENSIKWLLDYLELYRYKVSLVNYRIKNSDEPEPYIYNFILDYGNIKIENGCFLFSINSELECSYDRVGLKSFVSQKYQKSSRSEYDWFTYRNAIEDIDKGIYYSQGIGDRFYESQLLYCFMISLSDVMSLKLERVLVSDYVFYSIPGYIHSSNEFCYRLEFNNKPNSIRSNLIHPNPVYNKESKISACDFILLDNKENTHRIRNAFDYIIKLYGGLEVEPF